MYCIFLKFLLRISGMRPAPVLWLLCASPLWAQNAPVQSKSSYATQSARTAFAPAATVTNNNSFIQVTLKDDGKFTIGDGAGRKLLFGHPGASTSDTMLRVDATSYSIHTGSSTGAILSGMVGTVNITTANIRVTERLSIVKSRGTRNQDTVEIFYQLTNLDSVAHNVGLRVQLDTMLGSNDGAPFRVPFVGEITKDRQFDNDPATVNVSSIPLTTLVFDSLANPTAIGLFTFNNIGYKTPDRLVFGYWPISSGAWDYTVDPTRSFLDNNNDGKISGSSPDSDSSVIVWWGYPDAKAINLLPGGTTSFAILYGLGDYTFQNWSPFQIGLFAPAELTGEVQGNSYVYHPSPFVVSAFFSNVTASAVSGAQATLRLRPGFSLDTGETATKPIEVVAGSGVVASSATAEVDWRVKAVGRNLGTQTFSVITQVGASSVNVLRNVFLTNIPNAVYGQATDIYGVPIAGAAVTVLNGGVQIGAATTQTDGTYAVGSLPAGTYTVRIVAAGRADSYFQAIVTDTTEAGASTNPSVLSAGNQLQSFSYPNPVHQGSAKITFYAESAGSAEIQLFTTAGRAIRTLSVNAPGAGWQEVNWPIADVANGVYLYRVSMGERSATGKIAVLKWVGR